MERSEKIVRQRNTPIKAITEIPTSSSFTGRRNHSITIKIREHKTFPTPFIAAIATHFAFAALPSEISSLDADNIPGRIGTTSADAPLTFLLNKLNFFILTTPNINAYTFNDRPFWPTHQGKYRLFFVRTKEKNSFHDYQNGVY